MNLMNDITTNTITVLKSRFGRPPKLFYTSICMAWVKPSKYNRHQKFGTLPFTLRNVLIDSKLEEWFDIWLCVNAACVSVTHGARLLSNILELLLKIKRMVWFDFLHFQMVKVKILPFSATFWKLLSTKMHKSS